MRVQEETECEREDEDDALPTNFKAEDHHRVNIDGGVIRAGASQKRNFLKLNLIWPTSLKRDGNMDEFGPLHFLRQTHRHRLT